MKPANIHKYPELYQPEGRILISTTICSHSTMTSSVFQIKKEIKKSILVASPKVKDYCDKVKQLSL